MQEEKIFPMIRVIGSVEPEICMNILRNLIEKLGAKLPATAHGYSMVKCAHLEDDAFSKLFELDASPIEGQSWQENDKKRG